ncbi:VOC family protein [Microbulbifer variabilis]|uniref:VOC family protein n=1 Tax=Microbulbifer variabilis TaxID=266805 RepID=UPI001CFEAEA9|nr:VOC family protein [Microbulbifer variabilis]
MVKNPDHVTVAVTELEESRKFFELLGFELKITDVISGEEVAKYMDVPDVEADHLTMVLSGAEPRFEIQLLHFRNPKIFSDSKILNLARPGYNHLCFRVENIELAVDHLKKNGVRIRSDILEYLHRKLVYIEGPEYITVELAEWLS